MKSFLRLLRALPLIILNGGWLLPACLSWNFLLTYLHILQRPNELRSFPHLSFAQDCAAAAAVWLFIAIAYGTFQNTKKALPLKP